MRLFSHSKLAGVLIATLTGFSALMPVASHAAPQFERGGRDGAAQGAAGVHERAVGWRGRADGAAPILPVRLVLASLLGVRTAIRRDEQTGVVRGDAQGQP